MIIPLSWAGWMAQRFKALLLAREPVQFVPVLGVAFQAPSPTKPAFVTITAEAAYALVALGTLTDELEIRIGPDASVATGGGYLACPTLLWALTGIALTIGTGTKNRQAAVFILPAGWYGAVRRVGGTRATISGATAQRMG